MNRRFAHLAILTLGIAPIAILSAQQSAPAQAPTAEQVFKNIKVFKGVPASDLIPAMEFMSASLKYECTGCHNPKDYAEDTPKKETSRKMVLMQREINEKNFNGRLEVTCNSCHMGSEHPAGTPIPEGVAMRHQRMEGAPKPDELIAKHVKAVGANSEAIVRTGSLTAKNDLTHKPETTALEFIQAGGGKFSLVAGDRKVVSNGQQVAYGGQVMYDEPAAIFGRMGRSWRGEDDFKGLERMTVAGKDKVGRTEVVVVRAVRPATGSTEELYFDTKSGLLVRMVNVKRSSIGSVLTVYDYESYKKVGSAQVPMKVTATFAGGDKWEMAFKAVKTDPKVDESSFAIGSGS